MSFVTGRNKIVRYRLLFNWWIASESCLLAIREEARPKGDCRTTSLPHSQWITAGRCISHYWKSYTKSCSVTDRSVAQHLDCSQHFDSVYSPLLHKSSTIKLWSSARADLHQNFGSLQLLGALQATTQWLVSTNQRDKLLSMSTLLSWNVYWPMISKSHTSYDPTM